MPISVRRSHELKAIIKVPDQCRVRMLPLRVMILEDKERIYEQLSVVVEDWIEPVVVFPWIDMESL